VPALASTQEPVISHERWETFLHQSTDVDPGQGGLQHRAGAAGAEAHVDHLDLVVWREVV
jgi:hypothetical protein